MQLSEGKIGESYQVEGIDLPFPMKRRLEALGMTEHAPLAVLHRKGKGILIIKLRGSRFALGYNITRQIEVKTLGQATREGVGNATKFPTGHAGRNPSGNVGGSGGSASRNPSRRIKGGEGKR